MSIAECRNSHNNILFWIYTITLCVGLYLTTYVNYLLFHSLVELFSIIVAATVFVITWNSVKYIKNPYLIVVGVSSLFIGILDLLHTLSYKGMPIFTDYDFYANQLWIAARGLESCTFLAAFLFLLSHKTVKAGFVFVLYSLITSILVASIFYWKIFPVCFVAGKGLTAFKVYSEYAICTILVASIVLLIRSRKLFAEPVYKLLLLSMVFTIISELAFTFYIDNFGISNIVGHYFKLFSFMMIYRAIVATGIEDPYHLIFNELNITNKDLQKEIDSRIKTEIRLESEIEEHRRTEEALKESESTIQNKLKAILEPEGDIGALELSDIIDSNMLQTMLEDFHRLTGMLGAVLDISGKVLVAVGWQDICTKFHRCHPETLKNCIESDTTLTTDVPIGEFRHYRCKNNMWDMVTPLVVGGRHVGNIFIGQFFYLDELPDVERFREQARRYGFDETEYLAALDRVPRFSREKADLGMQFYAKLTSMVSSLSYSSIKVSRMLNERIHLEEQLRQSQKMEAIGQLAGGVAHDFNNILQVISGYGSLMKMNDTLDDQQKKRLDHILSASEKAAQLTKGLLAFSRKQVMILAPVNLSDIIENVKKFLARIIGEDIQLKTITYENNLKIYADAGQIEQVLINLATNARDAMQKGGLLTIEAGFQPVESPFSQEFGQTKPGRYAVVTVTDNGCGMDKETCNRIFEPFYTTKEVGKGTGLGMAIVYGIVKQHNGYINVYSEPSLGTTFRIYIPICEVEQPKQDENIVQVAQPQGGTETILLAEDDADVRNFVVSVLTKFGYKVIQAVDGKDAVEKFTEHSNSVSMILMDMIMPKKNGKEAYDEIVLLKPNVKILYVSGYTADFIQARGVSEEGIELMMKPVQPMELLRKVRELLDR